MNKIVSLWLLVVGVFTLQMTVQAEEAPAKTLESKTNSWSFPSVTLTTTFASQYLAFGSGAILYDKPVIQSDIFMQFKNGFYADLWNSTSLDDDWNNNLGDEVDYGIGWQKNVLGFDLKVGVTYFDEPKVFNLGAGDILYSHIKVGREMTHATVFVGFENYTTMPDSGFQGGNLYTLGMSRTFKLDKKEKIGLSAYLALVYDDGGFGEFGLKEGFLHRGHGEINWKLTKRLTLTLPSITWYAPMTTHDVRRMDVVAMAGVSFAVN